MSKHTKINITLQEVNSSAVIENLRKNNLIKYQEKLEEILSKYSLNMEKKCVTVCKKIPPECNVFATFEFTKNFKW